MQDENTGLPIKSVKSFMSKIPSVFTGGDLIQWILRTLDADDAGKTSFNWLLLLRFTPAFCLSLAEALHLASFISSHGYVREASIFEPCIVSCVSNLDPSNWRSRIDGQERWDILSATGRCRSAKIEWTSFSVDTLLLAIESCWTRQHGLR